MDTNKPRRAHGRRRGVILALAGVLVLVAGAVGYAVSAGLLATAPSMAPTAQSSTSDPEAAPTRTSAPPLPGPFVSPSRTASPNETVIPRELEPVAPSEAVEAPDGMRLALTRLEHVQGQALQPGEIAGPAVRVTVTMTNGTKKTVDTSLVVVNAYVGADRRPAGTLIRPGGLPFAGPLAPGETSYGIYLFSIGEKDRHDATITVDYQGAGATVVFSGDVG